VHRQRHLGHGIALRPEHYTRVFERLSEIDWVEVVSERLLWARGGAHFEVLERLRLDLPVALHGTALSIGSVDPLDMVYLRHLKALVDRVQPAWVSDHLVWSSFGGAELDLMPLPYTEESLRHVVERVLFVQEFLQRRILLENPSSYLAFRDSTIAEWDFLAAVAEQADCGILLDVNNVYVTARNQGFEPSAYLDGLSAERVCEIHLAGHRDVGDLLLDTHEGPVPSCVWRIYEDALRRFGPLSTIVEWDTAVPELEVMVGESRRAAAIEKDFVHEAGPAAVGSLCAHVG
jgi:uncharacterized protein (UPF0276 family)